MPKTKSRLTKEFIISCLAWNPFKFNAFHGTREVYSIVLNGKDSFDKIMFPIQQLYEKIEAGEIKMTLQDDDTYWLHWATPPHNPIKPLDVLNILCKSGIMWDSAQCGEYTHEQFGKIKQVSRKIWNYHTDSFEDVTVPVPWYGSDIRLNEMYLDIDDLHEQISFKNARRADESKPVTYANFIELLDRISVMQAMLENVRDDVKNLNS